MDYDEVKFCNGDRNTIYNQSLLWASVFVIQWMSNHKLCKKTASGLCFEYKFMCKKNNIGDLLCESHVDCFL